MSNILVVLGSAREGRVAEKVYDYVKADIDAREGVNTVLGDLKEINLPFYAHAQAPASPDYEPTDERVIAWGKMVADADGVVFITPEYNHTISAIEKNALDSLLSEWADKPAAVVAYGWTGGSLAVQTLDEVLPHLKTKYDPNAAAKLGFMKDLNPDGSLLNAESVAAQIKTAIDSIV
jgi:NAD(P)H-dependent FMN reductase